MIGFLFFFFKFLTITYCIRFEYRTQVPIGIKLYYNILLLTSNYLIVLIFLKFLFLYLFYWYECFAYMYECTVCVWCLREWGGIRSPDWGYRQVWPTMWVLGTRPRSSGKVIIALNCWAPLAHYSAFYSYSVYLTSTFWNFMCINVLSMCVP